MKKIFVVCFVAMISQVSFAFDLVEGTWKTIDEETGAAKSIVKVWIDNDELKGKIVELIDPDEPNPLCGKCEGAKKDQAIIGMEFIGGLQKNGKGWDDGYILDPATGKVYSAKITANEDGSKLNVRGYIGFAFAGRTQIWERVAEMTPQAQTEVAE